MKEAQVRQEVYRLARVLGYEPITQTDLAKCPTCGTMHHPPKGRPDILWLSAVGPDRVSEVKVMRQREKSFPFKRIESDQRNWLNWWRGKGGIGYLALGTLIPRHRKLWLVEWGAWLEIEKLIRPYQNSIPLTAGKGVKRELQDQKLDMTTLLSPWELRRVTGGWRVPVDHLEVRQ